MEGPTNDIDAWRRDGDLTAEEARVLGCLIEKEATTPDAYPLTVNSLRHACNQSTSRDPVMALTDHDVESALASLRDRGLTRTVHSTSNRATKYRHVLPEVLDLEADEAALLAVLLLRGEQTAGELKTRTERIHAFETVDDVGECLRALATRPSPLVEQLERQPGQKDPRWIERLSARDRPAPAPPDSPDTADPYSTATAEFYDLLATAHWDSFGARLIELLEDVDVGAGPIVDVGAGTGIGLAYIHAAAPDAEILAIEPSRAMRTALHTRLLLDDDLRRITTVDPRPWSSADLPERAAALVMSAALGHLGASDRELLWRFIAGRMAPGAPAVIEVLPPERPMSVPMTRYRERAVGRFMYEGWQRGEPAGDREMDWTMEYRVLSGDAVVQTSSVRSRWTCFGVDDVRAEIEPFGLSLAAHDDFVVVTAG